MDNFISNVMPKAAGTAKVSDRQSSKDTSFQKLMKAEADSDDKRLDSSRANQEKPDVARDDRPVKEDDFAKEEALVKEESAVKDENPTEDDKTADTKTEAGLSEFLAAMGGQTSVSWNNMIAGWLNTVQQSKSGDSGEPVSADMGNVQTAGETVTNLANVAVENAAKEQAAFMQALGAEVGTKAGIAGTDAGMTETEVGMAGTEVGAAEIKAGVAELSADITEAIAGSVKSAADSGQPVLTEQLEVSGQLLNKLNGQADVAEDTGLSKKENQGFIKNPVPMENGQTGQVSEQRQQVLQALKASLSEEGLMQATGKEETFAGMKAKADITEEQPQMSDATGKNDSPNPLAELTSGRSAASEVKAPESSHVHMEVGQTEDLSKKLLEQIMKKVSLGQKELEVALEPANLGRIIVRISYGDHNTTVSLMCSESKTLNLLAQNSKEMGAILEANLGEPATIYVDKQQESNYLNQERDNERRQEQYQQEEQKHAEKQDSDEDPIDFMQKLRLQMVNGLQMSYN